MKVYKKVIWVFLIFFCIAETVKFQSQQLNHAQDIKHSQLTKTPPKNEQKAHATQNSKQKQEESQESSEEQSQSNQKNFSGKQKIQQQLQGVYTVQNKSQFYYIPAKIGDETVNMALNSEFPSWVLVGKGKICHKNSCKSHPGIHCDQKSCVSHQSQLKNDNIIAENNVDLTYELTKKDGTSTKISSTFISVQKINSQQNIWDQIKKQKDIVGAINFADWKIVTFSRGTSGKDQIQSTALQKATALKEVDQISINGKSKKFSPQKMIFALQKSESYLKVPKKIHQFIISQLKSLHEDNKCEINDQTLKCTANIKGKKNSPIKIGILQMNSDDLINEKGKYQYQLLIGICEKDVYLTAKILQKYKVQLNQGKIAAIKKNSDYIIADQAASTDDDSEDESKHQPNINSKEEQQQSSEEQSEQFKHKTAAKNKDSEQEKEKDSEEDKEKDSESKQIAPKPKSRKKHFNTITPSTAKNNNAKEYSKGYLFFIVIYGSLAIIILAVIKFKASESFAARVLASILRPLDKFIAKKKGYQPTETEQFDYGSSIPEGFQSQKGKKIFWEQNSFEGI